MTEEIKIRCKWCGGIVDFPNEEECDGCWEIRSRIPSRADATIKMLNAFFERRNKKVVLENMVPSVYGDQL